MPDASSRGPVRVVSPVRNQLILDPRDLDAFIPEDHVARSVWQFVKSLDLGVLYGEIQAREGEPGRPATDPAVLLALWLYATVDGVGSARRLDRLCREHDAYRWICGGVPVNYHTLADFRTEAAKYVDELLATSLAALKSAGLVKLEDVAQDGLKVRASAGAGSFHREARMRADLLAAEARVAELRKELEDDPSAANRRERAARERAARERAERLRVALEVVPQIKAQRAKDRGERYEDPPDPPSGPGAGPEDGGPNEGVAPRSKRNDGTREVRVSTTDPSARVMKMADGGFRPAFNIQIASAVDCGAIVAFTVTSSGGDQPQLEPMIDKVTKTFKRQPTNWLCDGGFVNLTTIERLERRGVRICAPPPKPKPNSNRGRYEAAEHDSAVIAEWRRRMGGADARRLYAKRGPTAEWVNAQLRNFGLTRLLVREVERVTGAVLMYVMALNMSRTMAMEGRI